MATLVTLNTDLGPVLIRDWSYRTTDFIWDDPEDDVLRLGLEVPSLLGEGCLVHIYDDKLLYRDASRHLRFVAWVAWLAHMIDEARAPMAQAAAEQAATEAEEAARQAAEAAQLLAEREERCMTEFIGEKIRARSRGYKGSPRAYMRVREEQKWESGVGVVATGEFRPYVEFENEEVDGNRPREIRDIRKLEVKLGSRYETIWDDGYDDLPSHKRMEIESRSA